MANENPRGKRKHINISCVKKDPLRFFKKMGFPPGQYCTYLTEYYPKLERAGCEVVYSGNNNSEIVLGRDRNHSLASGKGGSGGTQCGMIDIVAGRLSSEIVDQKGKERCNILTGPNFFADAARIYLTQRGDIDNYFGLPKVDYENIESSDNASAVAIKSDHTRIIGRSSIKIYAGKAQAKGLGRFGEKNSSGGNIETGGVIELIRGERAIQPAVLGNNMKECIKDLYNLIAQAYSAIHAQSLIQSKLYSYLGAHSHTVAGVGVVGLASPDPFLLGSSFAAFAKSISSGFDNVMSQFNTAFSNMNYTGLGDARDYGNFPGADDICSTKVFLT